MKQLDSFLLVINPDPYIYYFSSQNTEIKGFPYVSYFLEILKYIQFKMFAWGLRKHLRGYHETFMFVLQVDGNHCIKMKGFFPFLKASLEAAIFLCAKWFSLKW